MDGETPDRTELTNSSKHDLDGVKYLERGEVLNEVKIDVATQLFRHVNRQTNTPTHDSVEPSDFMELVFLDRPDSVFQTHKFDPSHLTYEVRTIKCCRKCGWLMQF